MSLTKTEKLLRRVGYYRALAKYGRRRGAPFPDLSVKGPSHPSLGTGFGPTTPKRPALPPDAKQFPVGNSHKQGLELITPGSNPADYNGAKK